MPDESSDWLDISYDQFWDVPRQFKVSSGNAVLQFVCDFDENLDDYPPNYIVYRLIESPSSKELLGEVRVADVTFDETRRRRIKSDVLRFLKR